MSAKKILFLVGYDYFNSLAALDCENIYIISPEKEAAFGDNIKDKYIEHFGSNFHLVAYSKSDLLSVVESIQPDILVCLGWRRIISDDILNSIATCINVHPAILPQYKGFHPVPYVLMNEEKEHGITAHMITSELDGGDIILTKRFPINSFSTLNSLQNKVNNIFPDFLKELVQILLGEKISLIVNDSKLTKVIAKRRTPDDSEILANMPFKEVYNFIRSCDTKRFPAFYIKDGERVFVKLFRQKDEEKRENEFDI